MKIKTKKIISQVLIASLALQAVFASGFPSEPMVIYGDVVGANIGTLTVSDESGNVLKSATISGGSYGTNKTFDLSNKITLAEYEGVVSFKINNIAVSPRTNSSCASVASFQSGQLCSYNFIMPGAESDDDAEFLNNLDQDMLTSNVGSIGSGSIVENTKENLVAELGDNLLSNLDEKDSLLVFSDEVQVTKKVVKKLVIVSESRNQSLFIPEDTQITQSDAVIGIPDEIFISGKVNINLGSPSLVVKAGVEIPTNKALSFDKKVRVCTSTTLDSLGNAAVYYSQDNITWARDASASDLVLDAGQVCFDTDHFTSFAIANSVSTGTGGSGGGGGGGGSSSSASITSSSQSSSGATVDTQETITTTISKSLGAASNEVIVDDQGNIKIDPKAYIKNLRMFHQNSKQTTQIFGHDMLNLKDNAAYNAGMNKLAIKALAQIELDPIRAKTLSFFDDVTISYGIYTDANLQVELKPTYKAKLIDDLEDLQKGITNMQTKDRILKKHFSSQK